MKKNIDIWRILFAGIVALLVTSYLLFTNGAPFSLFETQEEDATKTEAAPEAAATPAPAASSTEKEGQALLVVVTDPLDQTIEADSQTSGMKPGADTWTKSLSLINSTEKPLTAYLYVQELETCSGSVLSNCVTFPAEVPLAAGGSAQVEVKFIQIKLENDEPLDAKLILVGAGKQSDLPFQVKAGWVKDPIDFLENTRQILVWLLTAAVFLVVFIILYLILTKTVYPFLRPERKLPIRMNVTDDTKSLWALFSSRVRELQDEGIGGSLVNPQTPPQGIDLPTNLGKEGEILKFLIELLNWILPRRGISIRLQAVENKKFGKGLSVSLERNHDNEVLAGRIFWTKSYDIDPSTMDYEDLLMTPIVLWVMDWWVKQYPSRKKKQSPALSRTAWDVQAYLLLASRLWSDNPLLGIKLYMDALYRDSTNRQAQAGLGRVWTEYSEEENLPEYEKRNCLEVAIAYLKEVTRDEPGRDDAIWFAAIYNLAVAQLYLEDTKGLQESTTRLFTEIDKYSRDKEGKASAGFKGWLGRFKSMALFFKHSSILEATPPKTQQELDEKVKSALEEIAKDARIELTSENGLLVKLDYRTQYNAACYFSRCFRLAKKMKWSVKDRYAEVALDYLRMALGHRGGLVHLAWKDRALEPLRKDRALKAKFAAIVPKLEKPKPPVKDEGTVLRLIMDKPVVIKNELNKKGN